MNLLEWDKTTSGFARFLSLSFSFVSVSLSRSLSPSLPLLVFVVLLSDLAMDVMMSEEVKMEKRKPMEEEKLETVDLSGLSLDSLPDPSINVASIFKLDLSNNNLVVSLSLSFVFDLCSNQKLNLGFLFFCSLSLSLSLSQSFPLSMHKSKTKSWVLVFCALLPSFSFLS